MKHIIMASTFLLCLITLTCTGDESPSSFTSPKDRKAPRTPNLLEDSKPSPTDRKRVTGGERRRRKESANYLAKYMTKELE